MLAEAMKQTNFYLNIPAYALVKDIMVDPRASVHRLPANINIKGAVAILELEDGYGRFKVKSDDRPTAQAFTMPTAEVNKLGITEDAKYYLKQIKSRGKSMKRYALVKSPIAVGRNTKAEKATPWVAVYSKEVKGQPAPAQMRLANL